MIKLNRRREKIKENLVTAVKAANKMGTNWRSTTEIFQPIQQN
jgi:hypothetical protein